MACGMFISSLGQSGQLAKSKAIEQYNRGARLATMGHAAI
jgi:hypothetical protein